MINVELDPRLPIPPVKGVEHKEEAYRTLPDQEIGSITEVSFEELDGVAPPVQEVGSLLPPDGVVVLSQTARMTDTGQIVIDVLLDVSDTPGAVEYEVRMAVG